MLKSPEMIIRTSVFREIGGFRTDLPHGADFELWMRVATVSDVGYVAGADQAYYRKHVNNMHHSMFNMLDDFSQRLACFDTVLSERFELLKDPDLMRDTAHRALARSALSQAIRDIGHRALARSKLGHVIRGYLRGSAGDEPTADYAAFALKAWPDARHLREWRTLNKLTSVSDGPPRLDPPLIMRMAMRKLTSRFRELRWGWTGCS